MFDARRTLIGLAITAALATAGPAAAENVLRWASAGGALTFDPHSYLEVANLAQLLQVYEALIDLDSDLTLAPQLAVAWKPLDATTWEFQLRRNVRFHDGSSLTAEDVVFSFERALSETSQYKPYIDKVVAVEAPDPHTVRITTAEPDPLLPVEVRLVLIMSKTWAEQHDALQPADFKAGEVSRHANGTGPFILETFEPGGRTVMTRNPAWWGFERYPHNIDRIVHTTVDDPQERLDSLLDGEIDFLPEPPFDALDRIRNAPGVKLEQRMQLRTIFLGMDQGSRELRSSNVKGGNPFADRRVRQALYQAIDIETIRAEIMQGLSVPAGMPIEPGVNGYSPELDQRLPYDPDGARTLLAEAGYADGFAITLDCPNNRYINDEPICRAVAKQLAEVGVEVTVDARPKGEHWANVFARQTDFYLQGWTTGTLDSENFFLEFYRSGRDAPYNATGYRNERVDELIDQIQGTMITYARDALIEEAWRLVLDDIVYLPLHHQVLVWAMRENFEIPLYPIGRPQFREARFK